MQIIDALDYAFSLYTFVDIAALNETDIFETIL